MSVELLVLLSAGLITGFSKFSVGGMGLLILPVIMIVFPGPQALGIIIPMYLITDLLAISSYRKSINWRLLAKLLPLCFAGILTGSWFLSHLDAKQFSWMLATIILGMLALGFALDRLGSNALRHPMSAMLIGFLGGVVSMISNAAGPLFSIYFLEQKLTKQAYVSTRSWAFMIINICKIPILLSMGLLTSETALISLQAVPGLVVGACIGYWLLGRLELTQFKWLIRIMASIAAVKLMIG